MDNGTRGERGFTLIEILVVVVILGIIAAIVIPAFSDSRSDANLNVCIENLRTIQTALTLYRIEEGAYPTSYAELSPYLKTTPTCPLGGAYAWSLNSSKYHVVCDGRHTLSSTHVCIHEDQPPTVK